MLKCNSTEVDKESSFVSASEDVLDVGSFFGDSESEKGFIRGGVDDDAFNTQKRFEDKKYSCSIGHDHLKISTDPLADITHDGEDTNIRFLYEMLNETDSEVFHGNRFSSIYEDALLDVKPAHALFDSYYGPDGVSCLSNDDFGNHSAGLNEKDLGSVISLTCQGSGVKVESLYNNDSSLLDQMKDQGLHEAFRNILGHETTVEDKQWLKNCILFGIKNRVELGSLVKQLKCSEFSSRNDGSSALYSGVECSISAPDSFKREREDGNSPYTSNEKKDGSISCFAEKTLAPDNCSVDAGSLGSDVKEGAITQKRMRKPTMRYLEHSLELQSRCVNKKCKVSNKCSRKKDLHAQLQKQNHEKEFGEASGVSVDKSSDVGFIQVPFGSPVDDAHPKEVSTFSKDMELRRKGRHLNSIKKNSVKCSSHETAQVHSEDICQASNKNQSGKIRRKHHIMWSLSEVLKLVEGVSKYGVGRWTEIKRLMFPSSSRRTSVDIKDKWRNLLKASGIKFQSKGKVHYGQKQVSHQVPESVLRRVRELAGMHPYPKGQKTKVSASF